MIDPLGFVLTTIRSDPVVAALTTRIRGGEPVGGADADWATEIDPVTKVTRFKHRFVVLTRLGYDRNKSVPIQVVRIVAKNYGNTYQDAAALAGAVSDAIHRFGPRINASGVVIYRIHDDVGMGAEVDPDTKQPHEDFVIEVKAATQAAS